ncbi:ATP-dependent rRNA helicase RRP3 [Apiospora aurea]|uniref:ATP-dependent rRNA helicase RRP3 n=1 Tax=Apiospora aurea TaxID=335848 RepID=A0ABR1QMN7_9PEZI
MSSITGKRRKLSHDAKAPRAKVDVKSEKKKPVAKQVKDEESEPSEEESPLESGTLQDEDEEEDKAEAKEAGASSDKSEAGDDDAEEDEEVLNKSFKELGIVDSLCDACEALGYTSPTPIQQKSIPIALQNRDVIGLAETGSGKTAAFALPILQSLLDKPQPLFGLVIAPTRELAAQIGQSFEALGSLISLRCAVIVGGLDMVPQSIALSRKPHIIVATPGRLLDHLEKTKGFSLRALKYLVMDEADRLLDMDFGPIIEKILKFVPRDRRTFLFSATMSSKVESLQRASLRDPVRVSVTTNKYQTVSTLKTHYMFIPHRHKDTYLIFLVHEFSGKSGIIFTRTVNECQRLSILLRHLGFGAIPLHGQLGQTARLGALNKFKAKSRDILVATDVAARGLDIPSVDVVINYDLPSDSKSYVHRVGRTARAGRSGHAISLVTQYDLEIWLRIEAALGQKYNEYDSNKEEVMLFKARVDEAAREARTEMKDIHESRDKKGRGLKGGRFKKGGAGKRRRDDMDAEEG